MSNPSRWPARDRSRSRGADSPLSHYSINDQRYAFSIGVCCGDESGPGTRPTLSAAGQRQTAPEIKPRLRSLDRVGSTPSQQTSDTREQIAHGHRLPLATPRCRNAPIIQFGCDLA